MRIRSKLLVLMGTQCLFGCAMGVPDIQEFWGDPNDNAIKINKIVGQVKCELSQAVRDLIAWDYKNAHPRKLQWLEKWAAQVTLTLTVDEKVSLNPGLTLNEPLQSATSFFPGGAKVITPQSFNLGMGGTGSSDATRTDALNLFYRLKDFIPADPTRPIPDRSCIPGPANATLFIQSDLKIRDWLYNEILPQYAETGDYSVTGTGVKNGLTHDVKFEIVSSGNITPTWKLVRVSANTGASPFFGASRDRTQDLLITLGPIATVGGTLVLGPQALASHEAFQSGSATASAIKSSQ